MFVLLSSGSLSKLFWFTSGKYLLIPIAILMMSPANVAAQTLAAALLPTSRSTQVGQTVTAFATIINGGPETATQCSIRPITKLDADFLYQTTDPATNALTDSPNAAVDIPAGQSQTFVVAVTPNTPFEPVEVEFSFDCSNAPPAPTTSSVNTLLLSASNTPVPDVVALSATWNNDGICTIPDIHQAGIFSVATINLGASAEITASLDTGKLPVTATLCQTDPVSGACLAPPDKTVVLTADNRATPTFGIFVSSLHELPFAPDASRVLVQFADATGQIRGGTSVAIRSQPDEFVFDVEWAPEVVYIDAEHLGLVTAVDSDEFRYTFDAEGMAAAGFKLVPDRILVIHGLAFRKVTSVHQQGNDLIVETEKAILTDAVVNGDIGWDYGVWFTPSRIETVHIALPSGIVAKAEPLADGSIEINLSIGGLDYKIEAQLGESRLDLAFTITEKLSGILKAEFIVDGYIEQFRSRDFIRVRERRLQEFEHSLKKMRGKVDLELIATASGDDAVNLVVPVTIFKIPIPGAVIPTTLDVKVQFVLNCKVPIDGSSWIKAGFSYDSDLGFTYDGIDVDSTARMGDPQIDEEQAETGASFAIATNFGVGFPRVELSIGHGLVVPWAQTAFLIGGSFAPYLSTIPVCQTADAMFLAAAGYDLSFFGLTNFSNNIVFFKLEKELLRAGQCPD